MTVQNTQERDGEPGTTVPADAWPTRRALRLADRPVRRRAALLTALVIGAVPAASVLTGLSPLVPLVVALAAYGAFLAVTRSVVPGTVAAVGVLVTVNADVPIVPGPSRTVDLAIVLGDAAVLGALGLLAIDAVRDGGARALAPRSLASRAWQAAGPAPSFLAAFAAWAVVGAAFAARDAQTAAAFGVTQFRYVAYVLAGAAMVAGDLARLRDLTGAFVVAVLGHAVFAFGQVLNRGSFGVSELGETIRANELTIVVLGETFPIGRFLGGLVGNNSAFATLAIPAAAVLAWLAVTGDGRRRAAALGGVLALWALCVPLSQYDSATVGFFGAVGLAAGVAAAPHWPAPLRRAVYSDRRRALTAGAAATVAAAVLVLLVGPVRVLEVLPLIGPKNFTTRLADYGTAVELALQHPLTGYGGGNVEPVGSELGFSADIAIHSVVFSYLAETGVVGLALWLGAVAATAAATIRLAWSDHPEAALAAALAAGALGFFVVALLDQIWDDHTAMGTFWLFAGAVTATYRCRSSASDGAD